MKLKQFLSAVIFGMLVSSASASPVPTSMTFSLGMGEQVNYTNDSLNASGIDRWTITLTEDANLLLNFVTGQDTTSPYAYLDKAELKNSSEVLLASQDAAQWLTVVNNIVVGSGSLIAMSFSGLSAGTYFLDIFGDSGLGYSGSVSAVPLPAAAWLFGSALLGMGVLRRRKQGAAV